MSSTVHGIPDWHIHYRVGRVCLRLKTLPGGRKREKEKERVKEQEGERDRALAQPYSVGAQECRNGVKV